MASDKRVEGIQEIVHLRVLVLGLSRRIWGNELLRSSSASAFLVSHQNYSQH